MHQRMYGKRNDEIVRDFFGPELTPAEVAAHGAGKECLYRDMMAPRLMSSLVPGVTHFCRIAAGRPWARHQCRARQCRFCARRRSHRERAVAKLFQRGG